MIGVPRREALHQLRRPQVEGAAHTDRVIISASHSFAVVRPRSFSSWKKDHSAQRLDEAVNASSFAPPVIRCIRTRLYSLGDNLPDSD